MNTGKIVKMQPKKKKDRRSKLYYADVEVITPQIATEILESSEDFINRPVSPIHVRRLTNQIDQDNWKENGTTICFDQNGKCVQGQHRLWAIVESGKAIKTLVAYGVKPDAFATMDTLQKPRTGGDIVAIHGTLRYRTTISSALTWVLRYDLGMIPEYRAHQNRIEVPDIEEAFKSNPDIGRAVERCGKLRGLVNTGMMTAFYYILSDKNRELAERLVDTLEDPSGVAMHDAFFKLRRFFLGGRIKQKDQVTVFAVMIKAANEAARKRKVEGPITWKAQGRHAENFPTLEVGK